MYLKKRIYLTSFHKHDETVELKKTININNKEYSTENLTCLEYSVGYWRKANHIHNFFVNAVQDGIDDCREYYVDTDCLEELLDICEKIIKKCKLKKNGTISNSKLAEQLLPTCQGFFFGNDSYDENYLQSIRDTIDIIEPLLEETDELYDIYYRSSW